jgi:hypothetical protein
MESIHPHVEAKLAAPAEAESVPESKPIHAPAETPMLQSMTLAALVDQVLKIEIDRRLQEELELLGLLASKD